MSMINQHSDDGPEVQKQDDEDNFSVYTDDINPDEVGFNYKIILVVWFVLFIADLGINFDHGALAKVND